MGEWKFEGPNPIVAYTVGAELSGPVSHDALRRLVALHPKIVRELPRKVEQQSVTFGFGIAPIPPSRSELGGVVFDYLKPDGSTSAALQITQNVVTFMKSEYTRWVEYWPLSERMLGFAADQIGSQPPVNSFIVIAVNKFFWSVREEPIDVKSLFRERSGYLADNILGRHKPCHSFHGFLTEMDSPPGNRIDNINVAISTAPDGGWMSEVTFHHRFVMQDGATGLGAALQQRDGGCSLAEEAISHMHRLNNELAEAILAPDVVERIPGLSVR